MTLAPLRLKKQEDRRLRAGHLWVFSNEVDTAATPLTGFSPGEPVEIQDARGAVLGTGYVNPHSLIAARLVSRGRGAAPLDEALLRTRIERALMLRERCFAEPFYRLVFGEGDGLPGLVVDRFGDVLVAQITTAGMERVRDAVVTVLGEMLTPRGILLRNDTASRAREGLASYVEVAAGEVPERIAVRENGAVFEISAAGQKTGWFYDHRMNRARLVTYAPGRRVLDAFSYVGGWGVQAAAKGAERVVCVDSSAAALEAVGRNAALNGVADRVSTLRGDAFEVLRQLADDGARFDLVILDPPAFIKRKKDQRAGEEAYRRIAQLGMALLAPDGVLISASCSFHLPREALQDALLRASRTLGRDLQLLEHGHQGLDHPMHPAIPETAYLKAIFARVGGG